LGRALLLDAADDLRCGSQLTAAGIHAL
jgi:hypothetical protein